MSVRTRQPLVPGTQSPIREVPRAIERPEYAWKKTVNEGHEPWVQTPETIEKMRVVEAGSRRGRWRKPVRPSRPA